ncbi:MAG: ABC transporter ATP-binding protein [Hydrogenophilus sp.]|nr:ABC transporter ATP-binding protein [Hydrogenophilus sp.]
MIEVVGVGYEVVLPSRERLTVLEEINCTIETGEAVAVVGSSGSGKSTLLGVMAGLTQPQRGVVRVDGWTMSQASEEERAAWRLREVGFVFQNFQLLPHLTALENVALPLWLRGERRAEAIARVWLERVGLEERVNHRPAQLSGGEQQRVGLARAFACRPRFLFADEPTGNLDRKTAARVGALLFGLQEEEKTTLVVVTHDETLARSANRWLRLEEGRVVEEGRRN